MTEGRLRDLSKSHISQHKVLVRFVNLCSARVSVRWINFSGEEVEYKQVESGARYDIATYGTHPWVFRHTQSNQLMGVQLHSNRATSFEAYRFVREKQELDLLSREQVVKVLSGRCVISVKIVPPYYTIPSLTDSSLQVIAALVRRGGSQDRLDRLGLPSTLQHSLAEILHQQG